MIMFSWIFTSHNADGARSPFALVGDKPGFWVIMVWLMVIRFKVVCKGALFHQMHSSKLKFSTKISLQLFTNNYYYEYNLSLGTIITSNTSTSSATVTGTVVDCSNNPVSNGNIIVHEGMAIYQVSFECRCHSVCRMLCSGTGTVMLIPEDIANTVQGDRYPQTHNRRQCRWYLRACGVSIAGILTLGCWWRCNNNTCSTIDRCRSVWQPDQPIHFYFGSA